VLSFPADHRKGLASTNMLREPDETIEEADGGGGVFPNRASCDRLIGAQLMEVHEQWLAEAATKFNMEAAG
jgi:transposase-like protein